MAIGGHNSDNETFVGLSYSIGLSFFDTKNNEIPITKSVNPIEIVIQRDVAALISSPFLFVNATSISFLPQKLLLQNSFKIKMSNVSLHIELKPLNESIAYLFVLKFGYMPIVNATNADYSAFQIFCPCKALKNIQMSQSCLYYYFLV